MVVTGNNLKGGEMEEVIYPFVGQWGFNQSPSLLLLIKK